MRLYACGTSSAVTFVKAMNRVDVVELVVDLVDVDLDVGLVDVDLDVDLVDVDLDVDLLDVDLVDLVDVALVVALPVTESHVKSVSDFLVLKNA